MAHRHAKIRTFASGIVIFLHDGESHVSPSFINAPIGTYEQLNAKGHLNTITMFINRKYASEHEPDLFPLQSLVDFIFAYQGMECTDPRDMGYAMLGMLRTTW